MQRIRGRTLKPLRLLEWTAWILGTLLVATYVGARCWSAYGRDRSVAAFEAVRSGVPQSSSPSATAFDLFTHAIDMSTWSLERIDRYRDAARTGTVPQALLLIPSVQLTVPVFDGTSDQNLNRGAGRIEGTARIGEHGNVGIAAHRDGFFRALKDVRVGDLLLLKRLTTTDAYRIVSTTVVDPSDVSVLAPTATRSVTLVTCYPFYYVGSAPRRFIVHARRLTRKNTPAEGTPARLESRLALGGRQRPD